MAVKYSSIRCCGNVRLGHVHRSKEKRNHNLDDIKLKAMTITVPSGTAQLFAGVGGMSSSIKYAQVEVTSKVVDLCDDDPMVEDNEAPTTCASGSCLSAFVGVSAADCDAAVESCSDAGKGIVQLPARIVTYDYSTDEWVFRFETCSKIERCDGCDKCEHRIKSHETRLW